MMIAPRKESMTRRSRRNHSAVFRAKVALAAVKGEATLAAALTAAPPLISTANTV